MIGRKNLHAIQRKSGEKIAVSWNELRENKAEYFLLVLWSFWSALDHKGDGERRSMCVNWKQITVKEIKLNRFSFGAICCWWNNYRITKDEENFSWNAMKWKHQQKNIPISLCTHLTIDPTSFIGNHRPVGSKRSFLCSFLEKFVWSSSEQSNRREKGSLVKGPQCDSILFGWRDEKLLERRNAP